MPESRPKGARPRLSPDRAGARAPADARTDTEPQPAREAAVLVQLSAEVEALRAELAAARAQMAELEARAEIDPLTQVFNRRGFDREFARALSFAKRYGTAAALICLDLDRFKPVNDTHGHAAGDAVLQAIAGALARHVRASDLVARRGGDEFAVLLWNVTAAAADAKAEGLERAVAATTVPWDGGWLVVQASAGVALLDPAETAAANLDRADRAMYARKAARTRGADPAAGPKFTR
ncbi:MAG TPA: GGDEF domain-containing protein [Xanthobacteraceae bacterium]